MRDLAHRVAVITGAAGGIGRGLAEDLADAGMRLMRADLDTERLDATARDLHETGAEVATHVTDVADAAAVEALATATVTTFGGADLVVNNAGVWTLGTQWESPLEDWRWVLDVNLMGVVHGTRAFIPLLLANPRGGHVVNVASVGGLVAGPFTGPYTAAKHAVVGLTKGLRADLDRRRARVGVTLACPGRVRSGLVAAVNRRPGHDAEPRPAPAPALDVKAVADAMTAAEAEAITAREAGAAIRAAIEDDRFWAFPGAERHRPLIHHDQAELAAALAAGDGRHGDDRGGPR